MKKASLFLNIILIAAVAYLYVIHFQGTNVSHENKTEANVVSENVKTSARLAYINVDTLDDKYLMLKDMFEEIDAEKAKAERQFKSKMNKFEEDVMDFQKRAQSGLITQLEGKTKQEKLGARETELVNMQKSLEKKLIKLEGDRNRELHESITNYLKKYNEAANLDVIFGYNGMGNVLFADSNLNITNLILDGLNEEYQKKKIASIK